jgi:hypothetical protein
MSDTAVAESGTRLQNFLDRAGLRGFPWKTATILYTISWGWLFIVRNSYWVDDWTLFGNPKVAAEDGRSLGYPPWMEINQFLLKVAGVSSFRFLTFIIFFGVTVSIFSITGKLLFITLLQRRVQAIFFLVLPFYTARVTLMTAHYTEALGLFFVAWFLLVNYKSPKSRLASYLLFFLSFQMFTLLVFFLLPVMHLFILENGRNFQKCLIFLKSKAIFISLPVIYWVLRALYWPGSREYHVITSRKIDGFVKFLFLCLVIVCLSVLIYWKSRGSRKKSALLFQCGLIALFLGYAPYVFFGLVGNGFDVPITYFIILVGRSDWYSRHQILQSLGFSLALVGLIGLLPRMSAKFASTLVASVMVISVIFNALFGFEYVVDYQKQIQIVAELKISGQSSERSEIQIIDQTVFLNARQRSYRERDWLGLIGLADGVNPTKALRVLGDCSMNPNTRLVLIQGPETHWDAMKNWVSDGDMGFKVRVDDTPGACKPDMVKNQQSSGAIPVLFYFTGAKG